MKYATDKEINQMKQKQELIDYVAENKAISREKYLEITNRIYD